MDSENSQPGIEQGFKVKGVMEAVLRRADGSIKTTRKQNLVVNAGIDFICDAMAKPSSRPNVLGWIAIGSGTSSAAAGNTALGTELDRNTATYAHSGGTASFTMAATFGAGEGTGNVSEAGLLNAASSGTLFNRVVFTAIPKEAGDTLDITFTITFTPS